MTAPLSSRDRLLEAAIEIIDAEGEVAVRVERVADMAGVTKPSIYHFFNDREGLVVAALAERYRRSITHSLSSISLDVVLECDSQADFAALLRHTIEESFSADGISRRRLRVQVLGSAVARPGLQAAIREVHQRTVAELARVLGYGQKRGWLSATFSPSTLAEWWYGLILGRHLVEVYGADTPTEAWDTVSFWAIAQILGLTVELLSD